MRRTAFKGCFSGYHHRGGGRVVMADFSGSEIDIPSFPRMRMPVYNELIEIPFSLR